MYKMLLRGTEWLLSRNPFVIVIRIGYLLSMSLEQVDPYVTSGAGSETLEGLECAVNMHSWIASLIGPYMGSSNLELGAGIGTISQYLVDDYEVDFCEASEHCRSRLKERFSTRKADYFHDFFEMEKGRKYDCIYSSNVMEHFEDDQAVISRASELLNENGYFVTYVPACNILYSEFDRKIGHYRRYTNMDIERLNRHIKEEDLLLDLIRKSYFNPIGGLAWFVKMRVLKGQSIDPKDAAIYDRFFPYLKWSNVFSKILKGQNMLFVYQKKAF